MEEKLYKNYMACALEQACHQAHFMLETHALLS